MPLKCYCPNLSCAEPILYDLTKPNLCPFCGTDLNNRIIKPNTKSTSKPKSIQKSQIDDDDEHDEDEDDMDDESHASVNLPEINPNDVEVIIEKEQGIKFGELALQQKTGITRHKVKKINKKQEIMAFRKEAGFGGRQTIEIVDHGAE